MYKELVVNVTDHETRVALLEDRNIVELFIERSDDSNITGNIYKGRVQRVLPGMQAAFVDIGLKQAAFLYVDDVIDEKVYRKKKEEAEEELDLEVISPEKSNGYKKKGESRIEELLTEGQEIMVQIAKSPIGTKGPRVTCHISLPGRFLVLMPTVDHIGISRRIEEEGERKRLKDMIIDLRNEEYGYIFRTAGEGIGSDTLSKEMDLLVNSWNNILDKSQSVQSPSLLHKDLTVTLRAIRDLLTHEADKLVIDSKAGYDAVKSFLKRIMPDLNVSVELFKAAEPVFDAYNLEGDITRALRKKVWLKSGGYIVIEHTEALVAIDVNTGRYVGKHNFEETVLKTNLEAVKEIAYQLRLRNIGGIIILDLIDMEKVSNQEKVYLALKEALLKDKCKTNVLPMSEIGLIQMTRKRVRKSLTKTLCETCFYCSGDGHLMSKRSICFKIFREIMREAGDMIGDSFTLRVHPDIADQLHQDENHIIQNLENNLGKRIIIYPNEQFHLEEFDLYEVVEQ